LPKQKPYVQFMGKDALCLACMFSYGVSDSSGF